MRLSRPCYDKPHRCPGWAGGGTRSAVVDRCENGTVTAGTRSQRQAYRLVALTDRIISVHEQVVMDTDADRALHQRAVESFRHALGVEVAELAPVHPGDRRWRFGRCDTCTVTTWPYALRWMDWRYTLGWKLNLRRCLTGR